MKHIQKILFIILILFSSMNINAQDDFDIKISEIEINEAIEAICGARGINFGEYSNVSFGLDAWFANLYAAHVEILPNNVVKFYLDNLSFVSIIDAWLFDFTTVENVKGIFTGQFVLQGNQTVGYTLVLSLISIDEIDTNGDITDMLGEGYAQILENDYLLNYIPDIPISLTSLTPELITDVFDLGTPPISTDDGNIYINYNVKGDRFVKIFNELQIPNGSKVNTEGDIYHLENNTYQPYASGFEFSWNKNSQHTFKSEENGIDYSVDNNHYKFNKWKDGELPEHYNILRTKTIYKDDRFTAQLNNSYTVNFSMAHEGATGSFGNINISGKNYTFPKSEYIYAAPLNEPVTISSTITNSGKNYYFVDWSDGNTNLTRNISPTATTNLTANYKGIELTNTHGSFGKNNQNKMVQVNGKLYKVYESMNRIWLERSSNNGSTWELMNNGKPIDAMAGGKYPSISAVEYTGSVETFAIVYNLAMNNGELRMQIWSSGQKEFDIKIPTGDFGGNQTIYSVPVISFNCVGYNGYHNRNGKILVAWDYAGQVMYQFGILADAVVTWNSNEPQYISSSKASNLTISKYSTNTFHLAWQENWANIKYCKLGISGAGGNIVTVSDQATISTGCGYPTNYYPSITTLSNGYPVVTWVGSPYYNSSSTKIIKRSKGSSSWNSYFNQYGSNTPLYPQINLGGASDVVTWTENNGVVKFALPWGVYNFSNSGRYIQLANSASLNTMYGSILNVTSLPYPFTTTQGIGSLFKTSSISLNQGRGLVVRKDSSQFFFIMGDVALNSENIAFEELPAELVIDEKSQLNNYLVTKPFQFNDNSELILSLYLGIADSVAASRILAQGKTVNFTFELIEEGTDKVLGKYENFVQNKDAILTEEARTYRLDGKGIGNKTVRLKIVFDTNISGEYTLLDIRDNTTILAKNEFNAISLPYAGILAVTEYALEQNYPNPFNPSTIIKYQIPNDGMVTLKIYDITGQEVKTLVNESQTKGKYEIKFDASNLSTGVYFYRLTSGSFTKSMKMLLIK